MAKLAKLMSLLLLGTIISLPSFAAQGAPTALSASELLALVAGNALPENIVHEISADGLAFRPDDAYRSLLKTAGADPRILTALDAATVTTEAKPEEQSGKDVLQHLSNAGNLLNAKRYDEAANELKTVFTASFARAESGFVMGELLRRQEEWAEAATIYAAVLRENPNFPEAHTKLSYIQYRLGDTQDALIEAKAAMAANPNNPEAHKNAGLSLQDLRKFDAGVAEYKEALRTKPDYASVFYNLGNLYREMGQFDNAIGEYKKAITLDPNDYGAHNNLGITFAKNGDLDSAIREYREAERLEPSQFDARSNLGGALMDRGLYQGSSS